MSNQKIMKKQYKKILSLLPSLETRFLVIDYLTTKDKDWVSKHQKEIEKAKIDLNMIGD